MTIVTIHVGTSWKMNKTVGEAVAFTERLNARTDWPAGVQPFVLPPHTALHAVRNALDPATGVLLGAQNAHWLSEGAVTGEISAEMVRDAGGSILEIGHSERRAAFNETDETVALKAAAAVRAGLQPLICVGESRQVRDRGDATEFVRRQALAALSLLSSDQRTAALIAYEPVWSIGDGGMAASADEIRDQIAVLAQTGVRAVLYGGSVDPDNAAELLRVPLIGGLFVGRSAWEADGLLRLVDIAAEHARSSLPAAS